MIYSRPTRDRDCDERFVSPSRASLGSRVRHPQPILSPARSATGRPTSPTWKRSGPSRPATSIQDDLRERCPIAHTDRFGGAWLPVRHDDVAEIAYDTERFSSRSPVVGNFRPPLEIAPVGGIPPISSDPPFHHDARKLLLPAFTRNAVAKLEPSTREFCHKLIDEMGDAEVVDAATQYAQHIPARVIAQMLGFPQEDGPKFRTYIEDTLEGINLPPEERLEKVGALFSYLLDQIRAHLDQPADDLTTYLIEAESYGRSSTRTTSPEPSR